jgi:hypothetical protein
MKLFDRLLGLPNATSPELWSIDVAPPSTLSLGSVDVAGATVHLSAAAAADTFVQAVSGDTNALTVTGGGVTVPAGQSSAALKVSVNLENAHVVVTCSLGAKSLTATLVTRSSP